MPNDSTAIRDQICDLLRSFPADVKKELVYSTLGNLLDRAMREGCIDNSTLSISPLMLACDKSYNHSLQFIADQFESVEKENINLLELILGYPLEANPGDFKNQAVHYASYSSSKIGIETLFRILHAKYSFVSDVGPKSKFIDYLELLSQKNEQNDTAFMNVCSNGDHTFLEYCFGRLTAFAAAEKTWNSCCKQISDVLKRRNESNATALTLSWLHGHVKVIETLVKERKDPCGTTGFSFFILSYADIEEARVHLTKMERLADAIDKESKDTSRIRDNIKNTKRCLITMQVAAAKLAQTREEELINDELQECKDTKSSRSPLAGKASKKKHKGKKRTQKTNELSQQRQVKPSTNERSPHDDNADQTPTSYPIEKPKFITLHDGSIVADTNDTPAKDPSVMKDTFLGEDPKEEIQEMLENVCSNPNKKMEPAIMESLCLDASMLLLSPHGMAMKLSPSQLEAVESVLKSQMSAVQQAKKIHANLLCKSPES